MDETDVLKRLLKPFDPSVMEVYEVSSDVNAQKNNLPYLVQSIC